MRQKGDLVRFKSGATVVMLDNQMLVNRARRVMFVEGTDEHAKGTETYMSEELLRQGRVVDLEHELDCVPAHEHAARVHGMATHIAQRMVEHGVR